ncbi:hypothetical protein [Shewanella litorisediminis]|uniref:Uncharacterized protein n=1 Tax=Shewanella litorisediminis TaxID=1173586 RepID=A0ABX7G0I9_9GAMM|nr:hypothetical protein [Shewanella litorisediminis]MCL2918145.1 hypothetical protein [Shewanella litorisediminis]QRH00799.1 hypothetical protein JQC75_13040 [Shewanella litorisediminis]
MSLVINGTPILNLSSMAEKRLRFSALSVCIVMIVVDHYYGNIFTTTALLLYAMFLFPAIYLNRNVQLKYFSHAQDPIIAFRIMSLLICAALVLVWTVAIVDHIVNPPVFPKEERFKELMGEHYERPQTMTQARPLTDATK